MTQLPNYDDLPEGPIGGRLGWHVFGDDDQLGLINLLTDDVVADAAKLIKRGKVFALDLPLGGLRPPLNLKRGLPEHHVLTNRGGLSMDDYYDNLYPQSASQWDSLAHVGYQADSFYNGATVAQIEAGERNSIDHWARHGLAGRAVVLDMPKAMEAAGKPYSAGDHVPFSADDLSKAAQHAGIEHRPGDIVVLYTGFEEWYADQDQAVRDKLPDGFTTPGIGQSEDVARYLWDIHCSAIVADNYAVEAWPATFGEGTAPFGFIHQMLIGSFGMALGELFHLSELVADCRETGVYEAMLVAAPMMAPGGIGSTANTVAIK